MTFLLRREGDDQFLEVAEAPKDIETTFTVLHPGNYSCSYRTHEAGTPSEPSATVTVEELGECADHPRGFLGWEVPGGQSCIYLDFNPEYPCPGLGLGNSGHTVGWITPDLNTDTLAPWVAWGWATKKGVPGTATAGQRSGGLAERIFLRNSPKVGGDSYWGLEPQGRSLPCRSTIATHAEFPGTVCSCPAQGSRRDPPLRGSPERRGIPAAAG